MSLEFITFAKKQAKYNNTFTSPVSDKLLTTSLLSFLSHGFRLQQKRNNLK